MVIKYPVRGNRVIGTTQRPSRDARRRGVALVSVVSVLVLLMIVATPFLLAMRDSAKRGERYLYNEVTESEADSLFDRVQAHFAANLEHVERRRLDLLGPGGNASGSSRPPSDATPTSDTRDEMQLPAEMLREFNQLTGKEHRVWDVEVTDAQSRFNLNTCSVGVLANLLGTSDLTDDLKSGDDRIPVSDAAAFPAKDGVVRIGSEVIKYKEADPRTNMLTGCLRGHMADRPENGGASDHSKGDIVLNEAAFQIATRPFRSRVGSWARYTNIYEARAIGDMGVTALRPEEFDRIRRYITAWNGNVVGDGWSNPQLVRNNITAGDQTELYAQIKNVRYFGFGTIVRITDGVNDDYAVVTDVRGTNQVLLAGDIRHDYIADQTRIYSLARAPINVNTADVETLTVVFQGLGLVGKSARMSQKSAFGLAQFLKEWKNPKDKDDKNPEVGIYRTWEDFVKALEEARDVRSAVNGDEFEAVLRNALNACDSKLAFSTVPFTFRSYDVYEARATAVMLDISGRELTRRELSRVFEVSSARSSTCVLETQADFQDQIRISRDAKWFITYPTNINAYYDGVNEPASEYPIYAQKDRFPDTDRSPGVGDLRLRPAAFRFGGRTDRYVHFDELDDPEGNDLDLNPFEPSVDGPYSTTERKVDIRRAVSLPQRTDPVEVGVAPFACSFWYRPKWSLDASEHVIFDYGVNEQFMNRVSLRYDPARKALVLGVKDATRVQHAGETACEIEYAFADNQITWEPDRFYHIACTVYGCSPEMMELFVDGEQVGRPLLLTRLANQIPPTGDIRSIDVEDASGFPESGVLILRGTEGMELFEYSGRSDRSFQVVRRRARTHDKVLDTSLEKPLSHTVGDTVQLYGFAAPLHCDIKPGGATLGGALGPWHVYRAFGADTGVVAVTPPNTPPPPITGIAYIQGYQNEIVLTEWVTGNPSDTQTLDDLGPQGTEGIAVIACVPGTIGGTLNVTAGAGGGTGTNAAEIGGIDVVHYRVETIDSAGLHVTLLNRALTLRHWDASVWMTQGSPAGHFFPSYSYGDPASTFQQTLNGQNLPYRGTITAFVPVGIAVSGAASDYLDPADQEPQLGSTSLQGQYTPSAGYVQIDSEWIKYDTFDNSLLPGKVCFYRDLDIPYTDAAGVSFHTGVPGMAYAFGFNNLANFPNNIQNATRMLVVTASTGMGGGSGNVGSNNEPPFPQDGNDETVAPPVPTGGGTLPAPYAAHQPPYEPEWSADTLAANTNFRSWEDRNSLKIRRIANTIARDHQAGTPIIPCFRVYGGNDWDTTAMGRRAFGGFNDVVTLRDTQGSDEQMRVQWGYGSWMAFTQPTIQRWKWDRPQDETDLRRYPSAAWTRVLKFPSMEMPDGLLTANVEKFRFGKRFDDGGGAAGATIDEVTFHELQFPADDRRDYAFLGIVPAQLYTTGNAGTSQQPLKFNGIDEKTDEIPVFMPYYVPAIRAVAINGLPIPDEVFRSDGGLIRIDDELILYSSFDPSSGTFSGCVRGRFGTTARPHQYGAILIPVETYAMSRLVADADESTAAFELADASDFPLDGYLRIDDALELIGYTEIQGNSLSGPLGRIDPGASTPKPNNTNRDQARVGGALFRGRFGTTPTGYSQGAVALAMPFRHYDRFAERSDDPENSYTQFSWTKENAVWKRVTWDEQPVKNVEVLALVRFAGGPAWDSDKVIRLPGEQSRIPKENRAGFLYEIADPKAENLLNVESDRIEVRLMARFAKGAYDRTLAPRPNEWKETPWFKKVVVEYVAPSAVMSQE